MIKDLGSFVILPLFFILLPTPFPLTFFKQADLRGEDKEGESPRTRRNVPQEQLGEEDIPSAAKGRAPGLSCRSFQSE